MARTPSIVVRFISAPTPAPFPERALLFAELGTGATGVADVPTRLFSVDDANSFFGASQGADAAQAFIGATGLQDIELWGVGLDATGFTANTWTITFTGTTTAAGTNVLRAGDSVINVSQASGNDPTAQAAAAVAAVNGGGIPYSASNVAGVVTLTSDYIGASAASIPVSVDLYADRGERGVAGGSSVVVNNLDATGVPAALSAALLAEIETLDGAVWWLATPHGVAFRDSVENAVQSGWDQRNTYACAFTSVSSDLAAFEALAGVSNYRHWSLMAQADSPTYELTAAVRLLAMVSEQRNVTGIKNPGMVGTTIPGLSPPTIRFDTERVLDAKGIPIKGNGGATVSVRTVTNRDETDGGQPDLSRFDLSPVLATREFLERVERVLQPRLGKVIVADGTPVEGNAAAESVSAAQLLSEVQAEMVALRGEAILFAESDAAARAVVLSVTPTTDGGILSGFEITLSGDIVKVTTNLRALAFLR